MKESVVDLGCGPKKLQGALGVDTFAYPGVDLVTDLNQFPWPLEDGRFDHIHASHIIEHVADVVAFLSEVHRIGKPGAKLSIVTPHFSSVNSWVDPTHLRHLATGWYEPFAAGGYLAERTGTFEVEYSRVKFGKSLRCLIPKLIVRLRGQERWEKHYAFSYPAQDLETRLRIVKD